MANRNWWLIDANAEGYWFMIEAKSGDEPVSIRWSYGFGSASGPGSRAAAVFSTQEAADAVIAADGRPGKVVWIRTPELVNYLRKCMNIGDFDRVYVNPGPYCDLLAARQVPIDKFFGELVEALAKG